MKYDGGIAGYISIIWQSPYQHFRDYGIPEIKDLNIFPSFRKQGYGKELIGLAESKAKSMGHNTIGLGVGLYSCADGGYGPAQKLYIKLG